MAQCRQDAALLAGTDQVTAGVLAKPFKSCQTPYAEARAMVFYGPLLHPA
jgi:hypothetical protein